MRREKKRMLLDVATLEDQAAQLAYRTANLGRIVSTLSEEIRRKDEHIAQLASAVRQREKMIDAMQCAASLIQLRYS
ncbi:uncharacterized protein SETTUDRAFT_153846 [Exserohilum turcica Et28A]|uniref:Uncharacterized protein n=1 Tax=Exserohilum turcicum (strain 28A) TaxID=671987 RepID=R0IQB2_EXST2|nr:uncharacterized protein SETTUDRAFT_153846 [Exserohilum turcica Et28A]EOA87095.1 hypothetical protein SETTUDRAFT_153846 [Exserohilum turcica Et28A]